MLQKNGTPSLNYLTSTRQRNSSTILEIDDKLIVSDRDKVGKTAADIASVQSWSDYQEMQILCDFNKLRTDVSKYSAVIQTT